MFSPITDIFWSFQSANKIILPLPSDSFGWNPVFYLWGESLLVTDVHLCHRWRDVFKWSVLHEQMSPRKSSRNLLQPITELVYPEINLQQNGIIGKLSSISVLLIGSPRCGWFPEITVAGCQLLWFQRWQNPYSKLALVRVRIVGSLTFGPFSFLAYVGCQIIGYLDSDYISCVCIFDMPLKCLNCWWRVFIL